MKDSVIEFETLDEEFVDQCNELINGDFFKHYFLLGAINQVLHGSTQYFDAYVISNSSKKSWIIGFWIDGNYFIYGKDWINSQVEFVADRLKDFDFQKGFHFSGTNQLVETVFNIYKKRHELFKERIFYEIDYVPEVLPSAKIEVRRAMNDESSELTRMVCDYFLDEYKGKNNKIFEEMLPHVEEQLAHGLIWVLANESKLKCFCSIIRTQTGIPIIGSFYTYQNERGKGYGTQLLSFVSRELVNQFGRVWLVSDKHSPESNKVFRKVGYQPIYESRDIVLSE
jgi:predicted GNAT family acetyltransferase